MVSNEKLSPSSSPDESVKRAADLIRNARTLIVTAGAGMGVDSGLPDFRGDEGFWKAYPPYRALGLTFIEMANPRSFVSDAPFAWGFYGHRLHLYRNTQPHVGMAQIRSWIDGFGLDHFVVTSNVDGQFQKAGFAGERILEVHGSIHHLQCVEPCTREIWSAEHLHVPVDLGTMRAEVVPRCLCCGDTARPNVLMFGDISWVPDRTTDQEGRFARFMTGHVGPLVILECGAGTAIPTIRSLGERIAQRHHGALIRINPREMKVPADEIALPFGALEGLSRIDAVLKAHG